jgi:superfamily II DNA or RNA helicase
VFIDLETGDPHLDQWKVLEEAKRHSLQEMDAVYQRIFVEKAGLPAHIVSEIENLSILVRDQIVLARAQIGPELIDFLKEELNFLNTEYLTKRRLGKSTYNVRKFFKLIQESEDRIFLPRGFLNRLLAFLNERNINHSVFREHPSLQEVYFKSSIALTPSQTMVVNSALAHDQGVIVAPSGSGKTIIGLELVARRKLPSLILVHRKQILDQWVERIRTFLSIPKAHIGQFSGIKKKIGKQITVGLLQSLGRKNDLSSLKDQFGTIIVDECHHIPASTFREVIAQLNPQYIYGLTATPKRKHNDEKLIYVYIGDIVARMEAVDFTPMSSGVTKPLEVIVRSTNLFIPFEFTADLFQLLAKVICYDTARNKMIVEDIIKETGGGRKVLVLSERKEHLEIINLYLKGRCETIVISGDDTVGARKSKGKQILDGHYQAILSTGQFFGEGVDVRGFTSLILAFPFPFEGKLVQYLGRLRDIGIQRRIIDYRDTHIPFLEKQYKQRERYYKKLTAMISTKDPSEIPF